MKQTVAQKGHRGGFTLIEILVVLVIMGFLVAMVAPKLSGIVDSAVGTADDTNQKRLRDVMSVYVNQNDAMPSGMVNMIKFQTDVTVGNVAIPDGDNGNKADGKEFVSQTLLDRMQPKVHYLNAAEAKELIGMGIKGMFNLAQVTALATTAGSAEDANIVEHLPRQSVGAGVPVMMVGVGDSDNSGAFETAEFAMGNDVVVTGAAVAEGNTSTSIYDTGATLSANAMNGGLFARFDEGRKLGRIIMGMTNRGDLVQGGMLDESGVSPSATQNANQYAWGNYLVVLPRLQATFERLDVNGDGALQLNAVAIDSETGETTTGKKIVLRTPPKGYPYFIAQEAEDFLTASPEGHTWGIVADAFAVAFQD
jgi:prepilin-type N-terminal cleavage/methylation domain-containing protein